VTGLDIDLTLDTERGLIQETVAITLTGHHSGTLQFRIHEGLSVERSRTSAGIVDHRKAGTRLIVHLDPPLSGTRTLTFTVSGRPKGPGGTSVGPQWAVLNPLDDWYPTLPNTWAKTRVRVRAPDGWTVLAPGTSTSVTPDGVSEWRTSKPVRRIAVAAAPGMVVQRGTIVATEMNVASTSDGHAFEAVADVLRDPMAWFAGALAPYPFDTFNLVFVPGFQARASGGGILIVGTHTPLEGRSDGADLLAGQWFGELLAGDGRWIDSFAAWQAVVYCRDRALRLPTQIARLREQYLALTRSDTPLSRADMRTPDTVVRGKGSAVPDMIRLTTGDRDFYAGVRDLFKSPGRPPLDLAAVRSVLAARSGRDLAPSFGEWFDRTDIPEFDVVFRTFPASTGGWRADLSLIQKRDLYTLPVEIVFHGAGESHRQTLDVVDQTTAIFYILPFRPARVELDPLNRIYRREGTTSGP
jgi:hypothetical protein